MKNTLTLLILFTLTTSCVKYNIKDNGVYYIDWNEAKGKEEKLLKNADKNSFESLSNDYYGKDKNYVFYKGNKIAGADPKTFQLIEGGYAIDNNRAYYYGDSIDNSNSRGFEIIDKYYSKDHKNVYYTTNPLNVCSVKNFDFVYKDNSESKWARWTTDGCYYYMKNYKTPSKDYENIKLYKESPGISSDKKHVYYLNRNIYYNNESERILDTVDISSFKVTGYLECEDKFGCINIFYGRKNCN